MLRLMLVGMLVGCGSIWSEQESCLEYYQAECDCGTYDEEFCESEDFETNTGCSSLSEEEASDEQQAYDECATSQYRDTCDWQGVYDTCCEQYPGAADCG